MPDLSSRRLKKVLAVFVFQATYEAEKMNTQSIPILEPILVSNRLQQVFGWPIADFVDVVDAMVSARNSCTVNDVPAARGLRAYLDGTRRLREVGGRHNGWVANDDYGLCSIQNEKRRIKLLVCNTDESTGLVEGVPQNRNKKGAATSFAISGRQMFLESIMSESAQTDKSGFKIWYLFVFSDDGEVVRAELACPSGTVNGFFDDFSERIILMGPEGSGNLSVPIPVSVDDSTEIEISVTRRQA